MQPPKSLCDGSRKADQGTVHVRRMHLLARTKEAKATWLSRKTAIHTHAKKTTILRRRTFNSTIGMTKSQANLHNRIKSPRKDQTRGISTSNRAIQDCRNKQDTIAADYIINKNLEKWKSQHG